MLSGVAEEFFFRGAMMAALGPTLATFIFAALHWPVNKAFAIWPVFALSAGVILALEGILTRVPPAPVGLIAPMLTHVTVNLLNLWRITDRYRIWTA